MAIYHVTKDALSRLPVTSFGREGIMERNDLQRLLRNNIAALDDDLLVIAEEFGEWDEGSRRVDLLCLDRQANLVVVELKRTEDGGHMDLQAIRYAAMVSNMTLDQAVSAYAKFLKSAPADEAAARERILSHLAWDKDSEDAHEFAPDVKIILAAADFSKELTTSVIWLNDRDLDIRCIRMRPYKGPDGSVLLDVQPIIPLPETAEYTVSIKQKEQAEKKEVKARHEVRYRFWSALLAYAKTKTGLHANRHADGAGWIGGGIGKSGLFLNYATREHDSQVELYIDFGAGQDKRNKAFLAELRAHQAEIETVFGGALEWQDLPDCRASRVRKVVAGGWRSPPEQWPQIHAAMVDAMIRLDKTFRPFVPKLKQVSG